MVRGFGFAFLVAVLCELCGKEELNREERQGFAKDAKQVRGLALRSWRQSGASFAVRRISPRRTPRIRKGRKASPYPKGQTKPLPQTFVALCPEQTRRMIVAMIDANHISERLASLRLEMSDLRVANARYWSRKEHTALDKQASALRQQRLIEIKLELADMSKRCA